MRRHALIAAFAGAMFAVVPAWAQDMPELDGAPPPLRIPKTAPAAPVKPIPKPAASKPATPKPVVIKPAPPKAAAVQPAAKPSPSDDVLRAERDRLVKQAEAQKAEDTRLATLAADLDARQVRLQGREADLVRKESDLSRKESDFTKKLAELDRQSTVLAATPVPAATPAPPPEPAPRYSISYEAARSACTRAAMSEAMDHDFYAARYEIAPRFYETERELRGRVRMTDRDGYVLVNTVCRLGEDGDVMDFDVIR